MTQILSAVAVSQVERRSVPKVQISWQSRAFFLSYWTEAGLEKESLLQELIAFLIPRKYFVVLDQGWSDWDLEIHHGIWSKAQIKVCTENHGGSKRLLRVRCATRMSQLATIALGGYLLLLTLALILAMPQVVAIAIVLFVVNAAVICYHHFQCGNLLYHVMEIVAQKVELLPVDRFRERS